MRSQFLAFHLGSSTMNQKKQKDYPKIGYKTLKKSKWDEVIRMISRIEDVEKMDPNITITDHAGTRTRPAKYVHLKTASMQLLMRVNKLLIPFDWTNWEVGLKKLEDQSFENLDIQTIGKLLTILLYYKESTAEISQFGIACQAQDLEDGRVLKLLKELEKRIIEAQNRKKTRFRWCFKRK